MNILNWLSTNPVRIGTVVAILAGVITKLAEGGAVQWYEVVLAAVIAIYNEFARANVTPVSKLKK